MEEAIEEKVITPETKEIEIPDYSNGEKSELEALENESTENFIRLPKEAAPEKIQVTAASYQKVAAKKLKDGSFLELKKAGGVGVGYFYALIDTDGKELSVTTWALHGLIRDTFKELGQINGVKLEIGHPGRGKYTVEVLK